MTDDTEFEAHFAALRERFQARLASYRERLVEGRNAFAVSTGDDTIRRLRGVAHELAGSSGSFGFAEIGELAALLEEAADRVLAGSDAPACMIVPLRQLIREVELSL